MTWRDEMKEALPGARERSAARRAANIEEQARELLAEEFKSDGLMRMAEAIRRGAQSHECSVRAIKRALVASLSPVEIRNGALEEAGLPAKTGEIS